MTRTEQFTFGPRTKLVLENLDTTRQVLSMCSPKGDVAEEVRQFIAWLEGELSRRIDNSDRWSSEVDEDELLVYASNLWKVPGKDYAGIHISVSFLGVNEAKMEDMLSDGGVGLFVPKMWKRRDEFMEELYDALPSKLRSMRNPDAEWPLWKAIEIESDRIEESIAEYVEKTESIVRDLLNIGNDIDRLLRKLGRRRAQD